MSIYFRKDLLVYGFVFIIIWVIVYYIEIEGLIK